VVTLIAYPLTFGVAYALFPFVFAFHQYQMARELNEHLARKPGVGNASPETGPTGPVV